MERLGLMGRMGLEFFKIVISYMKAKEGIEGIILGCTELSLLLNDIVSPVPCLDTRKYIYQNYYR